MTRQDHFAISKIPGAHPGADLFYAHTLDGQPPERWELLEKHLREVSEVAAQFAGHFDSAESGALAGLWHDLGKYHPRFQRRLHGAPISQPHAGAGAVLAARAKKPEAFALAFAIAGHHAGLANKTENGEGLPKALRDRLAEAEEEEFREAFANAPKEITGRHPPSLPGFLNISGQSDAELRFEFWVRFLFSALVDADRLCTERFCSPDTFSLRQGRYKSISELRSLLEVQLAALKSGLTEENRGRPINRARAEISDACLRAAEKPPGLFSLTVPTGGGKTLAAMRFALAHGELHGLRRVIVVIPFTSIIEQNAAHYSRIFDPENVLEHHSNLDPEQERQTKGEQIALQHELATENWEAPIVVTTTVQFFESLFTNHPSRARKLHNIAQSVIILDEVQSLPPKFLLCILDSIKQLSAHYRCSIVLSTATPPALTKREKLASGLENIYPIIDKPAELARRLKRVEYEWPDPDSPPIEWEELADSLAPHEQVLVVTHRRADARELARLLVDRHDPATVYHLSALMCPAHRLVVLEQVAAALKEGRPCRLVSTQLIEAGVDVDFPIVFRAMAGLDSIVQAGGRCNREGRMERGRVVIFKAKSNPPPGIPSRAMNETLSMLRAGELPEADDPVTQELYFRKLYGDENIDAAGVMVNRRALNFANVGRDFRLIEDGFTYPVIVPWGEGAERLVRLKSALAGARPVERDLFRALQPYTVSIYSQSFDKALRAGALEAITFGSQDESIASLYALAATHRQHYHEKYGLVIGDDIDVADPNVLIIENTYERRSD